VPTRSSSAEGLRASRASKSGKLGAAWHDPPAPPVRNLYSRLPETCLLELWELQHVLFSLGYVDDLADEAEIGAAVEVGKGGYPQ
jgi:hypothetical protein